jgi:DNA-binding NtrC family response regulator
MTLPGPPSVLIVEDELFIVLEVEDVVLSLGFIEPSSHSDVHNALTWLRSNTPSLAVIDYRLRDTTSETLVERLVELKVPTLIYSGNEYVPEVDDPILRSFRWLSKPAAPEILRGAIAELLPMTSA